MMHIDIHSSAFAQVHKFGGSSLASAERFNVAVDLVLKQNKQQSLWVVVSAPGDTTDALLEIIAFSNAPIKLQHHIVRLRNNLQKLVSDCLPLVQAQQVVNELSSWFDDIPNHIKTDEINNVLAIGEKLSALLLSEMLTLRQCPAKALDARDFLRFNGYEPDWQTSDMLLKTAVSEDVVHVVTGYIARNEKGQSITLGRNGSDYSASLLAALLNAQELTIWTDVKAIYSADPRKVDSAIAYQQVHWQQAYQLAQFGNPVLHARTLSPLIGRQTLLKVRSSFEPDHLGCVVTQQTMPPHTFITELCDVALITLHSSVLVSAAALSLALQEPVICLSLNAGNETWLLPSKSITSALAWLTNLGVYAICDTKNYYAIAWLKAHLHQKNEAADTLLMQHELAHKYENEHQSVWLLENPLSNLPLQQLHQLIISPKPYLNIVVAGVGNVGSEFIRMLFLQQKRLATKVGLNLAGVLNSKQAALVSRLDSHNWQDKLNKAGPWQVNELIDYLGRLQGPKVVVDITPSKMFARLYTKFIEQGCDVISANKQGVTLANDEYHSIKQALLDHKRKWLTNTTCGAGIPIQRTLQELLSAGDDVFEVSGVFSGTLSWLLCMYDASKPFSDFVLQAEQQGLTEPDPRDDLSGKDVQRKLLVLARELNLPLELEDIALTPLLPEGAEKGSWQDFWQNRAALDALLEKAYLDAKSSNNVLRYVASLSLKNGKAKASVALESVSVSDSLAALAPCDNIFVIRSAWYNANPLVLKGPGAGPAVTAGGLHADLAQLIHHYTSQASGF